jgi:hypothetical protein
MAQYLFDISIPTVLAPVKCHKDKGMVCSFVARGVEFISTQFSNLQYTDLVYTNLSSSRQVIDVVYLLVAVGRIIDDFVQQHMLDSAART